MAGTSTRENGLKETITLKWCTPRTNSIGAESAFMTFLKFYDCEETAEEDISPLSPLRNRGYSSQSEVRVNKWYLDSSSYKC